MWGRITDAKKAAKEGEVIYMNQDLNFSRTPNMPISSYVKMRGELVMQRKVYSLTGNVINKRLYKMKAYTDGISLEEYLGDRVCVA